MDHKAWPWRKRSNGKTALIRDRADTSFRGTDNEVLEASAELSTPYDCHAKDELVKKHVKIAEEALGGQERAEADAVNLKKELNKALQQGVAAEEKLTHLDSELKKCIRELGCVQEEQELRVHTAVMATRREFEDAQLKLEEKLGNTSRRLENLSIENTHLSKALLVKERLIEDLTKCKSQSDEEFRALMSRLDSTEKENAFLRYEFHILERELEIRNEEREFMRQSAEASQNQHVESMKKIAKLEAECQRLRILLRKRLPGPAALAKIRSEVNILGTDQPQLRRKKLNPVTGGLVVRDSTLKSSPGASCRNVSFPVERLCEVEEENMALKEILTKKTDELHYSRSICARTTTKLAQLESQLGELLKNHKSMELSKNEPSITSGSYIDNGDDAKSSVSWASALVSELEHFKSGKSKNLSESKSIEASPGKNPLDIRLMDDFVEMEKLAIVSVDTREKEKAASYNSEAMGKELVSVTHGDYSSSDMKQEIKSRDGLNVNSHDWLQDVLRTILDQNHISKRSLEELLEDIRIAVAYLNCPSTPEADAVASSRLPLEHEPLPISGYITWRSPTTSQMVCSANEASTTHISAEKTVQSSLSKSIGRIIELIEGFHPTSAVENNATVDYFVRVLQWKNYELSAVLQHFVQSCNDLLKGETNLEKFAEELKSALDWVITNCITCQDISSVRDKIKKHFGWDKSQSEIDIGPGVCNPSSESAKISGEQPLCAPSISSLNGRNSISLREKIYQDVAEENKELKHDSNYIASEKKDLQARLQTATEKNYGLMIKLQEAEENVGKLQRELGDLKESNRVIEDQIENQKLINEDLDTQLTVAKVKLNEVLQKLASLEVELDDKSNCCEELETMCLELQLQIESIAKTDIPKYTIDQEEKQLQTGLEVTAASVKLAECQETIFNLGKQLKALASPREAALFDKVFSASRTPKYSNLSKHASLLDRMNAEDGSDVLKSPKIKEIVTTVDAKKPPVLQSAPALVGESPKAFPCLKEGRSSALAIVPVKKQGGRGGFLRKLLLRRKESREASKSFGP